MYLPVKVFVVIAISLAALQRPCLAQTTERLTLSDIQTLLQNTERGISEAGHYVAITTTTFNGNHGSFPGVTKKRTLEHVYKGNKWYFDVQWVDVDGNFGHDRVIFDGEKTHSVDFVTSRAYSRLGEEKNFGTLLLPVKMFISPLGQENINLSQVCETLAKKNIPYTIQESSDGNTLSVQLPNRSFSMEITQNFFPSSQVWLTKSPSDSKMTTFSKYSGSQFKTVDGVHVPTYATLENYKGDGTQDKMIVAVEINPVTFNSSNIDDDFFLPSFIENKEVTTYDQELDKFINVEAFHDKHTIDKRVKQEQQRSKGYFAAGVLLLAGVLVYVSTKWRKK